MKLINQFLHTPRYSLETLRPYKQLSSTEEKVMISFTVLYMNQSNLQYYNQLCVPCVWKHF